MEGTREDHMRFCKQRALEYLEPGKYFSPINAVDSMVSDLSKHEETATLLDQAILTLAMESSHSASAARSFIEGFA